MVHAISDSSICPQQIQFLAFSPDRIKQQMIRRKVVGVLCQITSIGPALLDLFKLMLILVQQIVIDVLFMFSLRRLHAFLQKVDGRAQYEVPGLSFFAELPVTRGQSKQAHQPWQGKTLQNKRHQDQGKGEKDDEVSLRKRASIIKR